MNDKQYTTILFLFFMIGYIIIMTILCITVNSILPIIFLLPTLLMIVLTLRARLLLGVD